MGAGLERGRGRGALDSKGPGTALGLLTYPKLAKSCKIVLQTHVASSGEKHIKAGNDPGKKPLISEDTQKAFVDCLIRRDRGKQGLDVTGPLDLLGGSRTTAPSKDPGEFLAAGCSAQLLRAFD